MMDIHENEGSGPLVRITLTGVVLSFYGVTRFRAVYNIAAS